MKDAFSFGPFHLQPGERTLRKDGDVVPMGSRAFDMLVAMVERDGKVLTPVELMAIAWPGMVVEDSNVRVQVATLRRTLGCGRDGARYIANVAGRGYCFVAPVERIGSAKEPSAVASKPDEGPRTSRQPSGPQSPGSLSAFPLPLHGAIGREKCVAELAQVVTENRLTTVVGAAGAGKTTLTVLVAHAIDAFDGAMFFADLSAVDRDDMVVEAVASAIGYMPSGGDLLSGLLELLSARKTLIVLDNCEHVITAVASLCLRLVQGTGSVSILNTSREALRVKYEFTYLLRPLASPPRTDRLTAKQAMAWPAVQLFMERAREGGARGTLSDDEADIVAALCRQLDGNPHAIGLVASRVGSYGIQGVADLFASQFALHWRGRRDDNPRHQTVEALIDWSHNLLPERDRQVLYRLSVFSGAFPVAAAVAVTADASVDAFEVREAIGNLLDKSLLAVNLEDGETHARLLETTRAYATARLARVQGADQFARRHALYYAQQLGKLSEGQVTSRARSAHLRTLELGNIRTAIEWALSAGHDPALATTMWCMAAPLFLEAGLVRECRRTCERILNELPEQLRSTPSELRLLDLTAITYFAGADYDAMKQVLKRGLEISGQQGDNASMFHFFAGLHLQMITSGEFQESLSVCEQYAALASTCGDATEAVIKSWMAGSSRHYVGDLVGADAEHAASAQLVGQVELRPLHYFETMEQIISDINAARVKWALGMSTQALQLALEVIRAGHSLPGTLAMRVTLCFHILLSHGLYEQAKNLIADLENLSIDYNTSVRRQVLDVVKGFLMSHLGQCDAAIDHLQRCLAMLPPPKMSVVRTDALQALAECQRAQGDVRGALDSINEAIELSEQTQGKYNFPDLLRTKAEVLMSHPDVAPDAVEAAISEAQRCAQDQRALVWELRIARTIAHVRATQGKKKDARETLERVYSRFNEGFDTCDLKAAAQALQSF